MIFKNASLKFKLTALTVGLTALIGASSIAIFSKIERDMKHKRLEEFKEYETVLSNGIGAQFFERYGDIQAFALNPALKSSKSEAVKALNDLSALYLIYDAILLVDTKGNPIAMTDKSPTGEPLKTDGLYSKNYSNEPWFKAVMSGATTDDKAKGFVGTFVEAFHEDPIVAAAYGGRHLGNSFSAAVKDASGKVVGVLTNRAGYRWVRVAFSEVLASQKELKSFEAQLVGQDGKLVFELNHDSKDETNWELSLKEDFSKYPAVKKALAGESGAIFSISPKSGNDVVVGYGPVTGAKFTDSLGWVIRVATDQKEAMASINEARVLFLGSIGLLVAFAALIGYLFSRSLSRNLTDLATRLSQGSNEVASASGAIASSSTELSEASTEQAAAIQETAASIDEVSAMVKKSADNAKQSQERSVSSRSAAEDGKRSVQEMVQAIDQISESNNAIMRQVEDGNQKISEIVQVISEIGNKTKVINDIVFQTKLLSFNASVEAARAGEHGKGFAVVAEEVGNLAQMSGNAAKEISTMLEESIRKVEGIVTETKSKVGTLISSGKEKVAVGQQVAKRCDEALHNILESVQVVDGMVGEIATASHEQSQGVSEINKAINQLDQVTQQNSAVAQQAASAAAELDAQSAELKRMVSELIQLVSGQHSASLESSNNATHKPKASVSPTLHTHNVVSLPKREPKGTHEPFALKRAVGSKDTQAPSKDDPRFEDV